MTATCRGCAIVFEPRTNEDNLVNQFCLTCADDSGTSTAPHQSRRELILAKRHKGR